jgi:hypothetical protein
MWLFFVAGRYSLLILRAPRKLPGMLLFVLFYEFFLYWMNLYALLTVKNKSWVTR